MQPNFDFWLQFQENDECPLSGSPKILKRMINSYCYVTSFGSGRKRNNYLNQPQGESSKCSMLRFIIKDVFKDAILFLSHAHLYLDNRTYRIEHSVE